MKVNVCYKCHRFFEEDFLYCPYCGNQLKIVELPESKEEIAKKERINQTNLKAELADDESEENFYDNLSIWEKTFVDTFYLSIKTKYPQIDMKSNKSYIFFLNSEDRNLPNYGHWFFISKRDDRFAIRYRSVPNKNIEPDVIFITKKTSIQFVVNTIKTIINNRYGSNSSSANDDDEFSDLEDKSDKKHLLRRSDHSSVFLAGDHSRDHFFGDLAEGERKTQKEIWEIKRNYYKK